MEAHGQDDSANEKPVAPRRHHEQRLVLAQAVEAQETIEFCVLCFFFCLPVKSIEHLNGDKYRKSHCGRMRVVKDVASDARRKRGRVAIEVRREVLPRQLRARRVEHVPPSCSKDSCRANVHYKKRKEKKRKEN